MQSNILKRKIVLYILMMFFLILSCNKKNNLENQITIKINSIDSETRKSRVNIFDTIEVSVQENGYLMKSFNKVGEYVTDSSGSIKIKIDSTKGYKFMLHGHNIYGSANFSEAFTKEKLKNGQEVNIEVISLENR
ncbi:hypothetical protein [Flavobacterium chungangense]|uniref:Uncharacterized protein n=1 Tax=Flavobacterium chungangense TaxID=554283 RepID=A0A6V6YVD6_9FLAO|nr:hypothetical protein [Flavobacterium chungangense]CAD0003393.1 hypothetical protein FLACHUCJ7_01392 [Flavobacterium chungangense]